MSAQAGLAWIPSGSVGQGLVAPSWPSGWGWGVRTWSFRGKAPVYGPGQGPAQGADRPSIGAHPRPSADHPDTIPASPRASPTFQALEACFSAPAPGGTLWETGLVRTEGRGPSAGPQFLP